MLQPALIREIPPPDENFGPAPGSARVSRAFSRAPDRIALRHDEFIIERKGKPLAALVSVERLEQMRRFARRHALELMDRQKGGPLSDKQATKLALEAQEWARNQAAKPRRRKK